VELVGTRINISPRLRIPILRFNDADHEPFKEEEQSEVKEYDEEGTCRSDWQHICLGGNAVADNDDGSDSCEEAPEVLDSDGRN